MKIPTVLIHSLAIEPTGIYHCELDHIERLNDDLMMFELTTYCGKGFAFIVSACDRIARTDFDVNVTIKLERKLIDGIYRACLIGIV